MNKKGQVWSMDILFAALIFVGLFILIYSMTFARVGELSEEKLFTIIQDADQFFTISNDNQYGFVTPQNIIDLEKLQDLANTSQYKENYEKIKKELNLDYDFCIFFEDSDRNLVPVRLKNGSFVYGIGADGLILGDDGNLETEIIKCNQLMEQN